MPILLWSVRMSKDLRDLVLAKELLNCFSYKPAVVIVANLYLDFLPKTIIWLKVLHNDIFCSSKINNELHVFSLSHKQ